MHPRSQSIYTLHRSFSALNTSLKEEIGFVNRREMLPETIPKTSRGQSNSIETVQFIPDAAASRQNSTLSHPSRGLMARLACFQLFCPGYDCRATAKQTIKHFQFSILQRCKIFTPFYPGVVTLDWKTNVPSHAGHTFSCLYFKSQGKTIHNDSNSMLEVRWHHCLNEREGKTAERCSPMSQQTKAKGWQAENPDGPSRSSQASKGADEEMLYPEVADFWHPGTIYTGEGRGVPCILWMKLLERSFWCDARWVFVTVPEVPSHLPCLSFAF